MFRGSMSYMLDSTVVDSIKAREDVDAVIAKFQQVYDGIQYPPVGVYKTLLFCSAISLESDYLVSHLLNTGYDINYNFGYVTPSPLNVAIRIGREDYVRKLLESGAFVNVENSASEGEMTEIHTALELAIKLDRWSLAELMIPLYNRMKTRTQRTPLHFACLYGAHQCLERILETTEGLGDVNATDGDDPNRPEGYSPLMLGVHHGAWLVQRILENGGNAKHVTGRLQRNALHMACCQHIYKSCQTHRFVSQDLPEVIQLLVEAGCNPNDSESSGDTPLSLLCAQICCELNTRKDVAYPYEIGVHREVIFNSATTLLDLGASPNGHIKNLPLSVLVYQLNSVLQPFTSVRLEPEILAIFLPSAFQATILARDLFRLLIVKGVNAKIIDSYGRISRSILDSLLLVLIHNAQGFTDIQSCLVTKIIDIFTDIFRLLLLSCDDFFQPSLVFCLFFKHIPNSELFVNILFNFWSKKCFETHMHQALKEYQITSGPCLEKLKIMTKNQPRRLKNLARAAILHCFGNRAVRDVQTVNLPTVLKEYILSLE